MPLELAPGTPVELRLRGVPGATAVYLRFERDGEVERCVEVPVAGADEVRVEVELAPEGRLQLRCYGRQYLELERRSQYRPLPLLQPRIDAAELDVALVLDGTTRLAHGRAAGDARVGKRLSEDGRWREHAQKLVELVEGLAGADRDVRVAVIAFGDDPTEIGDIVSANDLKPSYLLRPHRDEDLKLIPFEAAALGNALEGLPCTSGGDFVDALAEALEAAARLRWRPDARRLVLLSGDSPGHSVLHPAPWGADLLVRRMDVDIAAERLHQDGVEIATIYHDFKEVEELDLDQDQLELLDYAERQYRRLASLTAYAFRHSTFQAPEAVNGLLGIKGPVARGAAPGLHIRS